MEFDMTPKRETQVMLSTLIPNFPFLPHLFWTWVSLCDKESYNTSMTFDKLKPTAALQWQPVKNVESYKRWKALPAP